MKILEFSHKGEEMQWIILIGDENFDLNNIKAIEHYGSIGSYDVNESRYCVDYGAEHVFYDLADLSADYEKDELSKVPFENPRFVMMIYTSKELMKKILQQENYLCNIYVDNDYECILPIEKFIEIGMPTDWGNDA